MKEKSLDEILKEKFSQGAEKYDRQRKHVIPCLEELYNIIYDIATVERSNPKILDLGAGTGLLTSYLYKKYPKGYFTLVDLSEEMLNIARARFKNEANFRYVVDDYLKTDFKDYFDLAVSSLSIHHLKHQDKEFLYQKIYQHLSQGGVFLNADQILGPNPANEDEYQSNWMKRIDVGSLSEAEKKIIYDRMKLDNPATLENNLNWLKKSGFKDVDVFYKYYNFCILYGKK
ncbi:MAG: methyltransferase type 12 [Methanobacteriales archaeon Met13]